MGVVRSSIRMPGDHTGTVISPWNHDAPVGAGASRGKALERGTGRSAAKPLRRSIYATTVQDIGGLNAVRISVVDVIAVGIGALALGNFQPLQSR